MSRPASQLQIDTTTPSKVKENYFRRRVTTEIIQKSFEYYSDGEASPGGKEDAVSVSSLTSDCSADMVISKRKIKSFRTLAIIVRALMARLPKSYYESVIVYEDVNGEKLIKAGTVEALIKGLTPAESSDAKHLRDFLLTYRYYTTAEEVLEILFKRFREHMSSATPGQPAIIPLRVINFIRRWLKDFFYDFEDEDNILQLIEHFIETDVIKAQDESIARWADPLKKIITEQLASRSFGNSFGNSFSAFKRTSTVPVDAYPNQGLMSYEDDQKDGEDPNKPEFTNINPVDIFRQLTIMEVHYFKLITPKDLFFKTSKRQLDQCPILMKLIAQFNNTSFWVAKEICCNQNLKQRNELLKRFIHIAQLCFDWKNFNTCLEIVGGLSMSCVQRLKKTWKSLPSKYGTMWKELQKIMAPTQNYIAYRNYFKNVKTPTLPYFGLFLSDLTLIQEKYQTKLAGEKINFSKMRMLAGVMVDMQNFQSTLSYPFGDNPPVQKFLEEVTNNLMDEDELYACSKLCESSEETGPKPSRFTLKSSRHKQKSENTSIEKFDFSNPKAEQKS